MAQLDLSIQLRLPPWYSDFIELAARLGFDPAETVRFVVRHCEYRVGDEAWKKFGEE